MIDYKTIFANTDGVNFPATAAVNASSPGATDGTEYIAAFIDDIWGARQAVMNKAGLTPNGVTEADGASQFLDALIALIQNVQTNHVVITASGTYSKPSNLLLADVLVIGGGGGGGGVDGQGAGTFGSAGGGGQGGKSREIILASALAASENVVVGAGGTGSTGQVDGVAGGTTSFGTAPFLQATGGSGGRGELAAAQTGIRRGGVGGVGSNGDFNDGGQPGQSGVALSNALGRLASGAGGGEGGGESINDANGNAGTTPGAGGSGASVLDVATNRTGGDGFRGEIRITEFLTIV